MVFFVESTIKDWERARYLWVPLSPLPSREKMEKRWERWRRMIKKVSLYLFFRPLPKDLARRKEGAPKPKVIFLSVRVSPRGRFSRDMRRAAVFAGRVGLPEKVAYFQGLQPTHFYILGSLFRLWWAFSDRLADQARSNFWASSTSLGNKLGDRPFCVCPFSILFYRCSINCEGREFFLLRLCCNTIRGTKTTAHTKVQLSVDIAPIFARCFTKRRFLLGSMVSTESN